MTKHIFSVLCLLGLAIMPMTAIAQDVDDSTEETATSTKKRATLLSKVRKLKPRFEKLPKKADYLMVCKVSAEDENVEDVLKSLDKASSGLKSKDVALLLVCDDEKTAAIAKKIKKAGVKVPSVYTQKLPKGIDDASEYLPETSDAVTLLDMKGEEVLSGDMELLNTWQEKLEDAKAESEWPTLKIDAKKYPVAAALKGISTPTFGRFNHKADFYVFLYSASWCPPCRALMPDICETVYPDMKASKSPIVELVLLGGDSTHEGVKNYREHYKGTFFAAKSDDADVKKIPGIDGFIARSWPFCRIVDKTGKIIHEGHGGNAKNWKSITEQASK